MNRPALLLSLALVTAFATAVADAQQRTAGFPSGTIVDLSYAFDSSTVYWPTAETFHLEKDFEGTTDLGYYYSAYRYSAAEHGGTHIDAPALMNSRVVSLARRYWLTPKGVRNSSSRTSPG